MTDPTHVEAWDETPRDLEASDHSRFRGDIPPASSDAVVVDLGNGLSSTTYVDAPPSPIPTRA